jgi:hypothetical protein
MVKLKLVVIPPPGAGLETATVAAPAVATNVEAIEAVSCVALTKVVAIAVPFHKMLEPFIKFEPFTVKVNAAAPAVIDAGEMLVKLGTGLVPE